MASGMIPEDWKAMLGDPDPSVRREACRQAQAPATQETVSALIPLLEDPDTSVRETCGEALKGIGGDAVIRALFPCLDSRDEGVRNLACEILEAVGLQSLGPIVELLKHRDSDIRKFVADVLGNMGAGAALPALIEGLKDPHPNVVTSVIESLGKLGDEQAVDPLLQLLDGDFAFEAAAALGKIGSPKSLPALLKKAGDESSLSRYAAIEAIGRVAQKEALPKLAALLKDKNPVLQKAVLQAVGDIDKNWLESCILDFSRDWNVQALIDALKDEDFSLRRYAILALGTLNVAEGNQSLVDMLKEENDLQSFLIHSLVKVGKKDASLLLKGLRSDQDPMRGACALILGDVQNVEALPHLSTAAQDPNPVVRISAVRSIGKLPLRAAPEALFRALEDEEELVRKSACDALGWISDENAVQALGARLRDESPAVGESAIGALLMIQGERMERLLFEAAEDPEPRVRCYANYGLGRVGGDKAVQALQSSLNDASREVRKAAVDGLARIGKKEQVGEALKLSFGDSDPQLRIAVLHAVCKVLQDEAADILALALADSHPMVRFHAVQRLFKLEEGKIAEFFARVFPRQPRATQESICETLAGWDDGRKKIAPFFKEWLQGSGLDPGSELYKKARGLAEP